MLVTTSNHNLIGFKTGQDISPAETLPNLNTHLASGIGREGAFESSIELRDDAAKLTKGDDRFDLEVFRCQFRQGWVSLFLLSLFPRLASWIEGV